LETVDLNSRGNSHEIDSVTDSDSSIALRRATESNVRLRSLQLAETLASRDSHQRLRVRILIAIPVLVVLLLTIMGGFFYQLTEEELRQAQRMPMNNIFENFARQWLSVLFAFNVAGAIVGYLMAHSITAPIKNLIRISERVASGDFSSKAEVNRSDEMGQLGYTFNYMIDSLNQFIGQRNRLIVESFSGGLITTDVNGTISAFNSAAEKLLGLSAGEVANKPVEEALSRPGLAPLLSLIEEVLWEKKPVISRKISVQKGAGEDITLTVNVSEMRDENNNAFGMIANFRDYAEWQRFYEQLNRSDRLATVGTFATGLAHEIRNPLGAIKATAQLLSEDVRENQHALDSINVIIKEVNRLDSLVREVQSFSHPSAMTRDWIDVNALVRDAIYMARHHSKRSAPDETPVTEQYGEIPRAFVSRDKLSQAFLNVIANAFQATPPSGEIFIKTQKSEEDLKRPIVVTVRNTGSTIPPDKIAKVFEPFYTTKDSGTGLGLSITYQIITNISGEISVASGPDWVAFTIRLPTQFKPDRAVQ
jgi:two-component system sensor histidine kinase AtoS